MEILEIVEHEDGGATYRFNLNPEENDAMCRNGIMWAIVSGVTGITIDQVIKEYRDKHCEGLDEHGDTHEIQESVD